MNSRIAILETAILPFTNVNFNKGGRLSLFFLFVSPFFFLFIGEAALRAFLLGGAFSNRTVFVIYPGRNLDLEIEPTRYFTRDLSPRTSLCLSGYLVERVSPTKAYRSSPDIIYPVVKCRRYLFGLEISVLRQGGWITEKTFLEIRLKGAHSCRDKIQIQQVYEESIDLSTCKSWWN